MLILSIYLAIINIILFFLYGIDKWKAKRGAWRIPEKTLLIMGLAGGSLGALFGMFFFHHKTKHMRFLILNPIFLIFHAVLVVWILMG